MKKIQPVQIWSSGSLQTGSLLNAYIIYDNLLDTANFYWAIWSSDLEGKPVPLLIQSLAEGNLTMVEPDYSVWGSTTDINQAAYEWIAAKLSLTLIP